MKLEKAFLHSKLARRIFWLFVVCALLPITVLAIISLRNVTAQLREQKLRELHADSREEAMSIYERIGFLETNLKLFAYTVKGDAGRAQPTPVEASRGSSFGLESRFDGVALVTPDGTAQNVLGKDPPRIEFTAEEKEFLRSGKSVLSTVPCDKADPCILLSHAVSAEEPGAGILTGQVRPSYLWDAENIREPMTICILDASGGQLFCSGEAPGRFPKQAVDNFSGEFEWQGNQHGYLASYWNLPLRTAFFATHWSVVTSEASPDIAAPLARFKASFLLVFLLALWIVLLLSLIQIRRNLIPLAKLKEGTRGISQGDFKTRVAIKSGDEFEELAGSFNSMAGQIQRQLKALKVVNEIDSAILSAWGLPRIIQSVCSRLSDILPHQLVSVSLFDPNGPPTMVTQVYRPGCEDALQTEMVLLSPEEMTELKASRRVSTLNCAGNAPKYLNLLRARGMKYFLSVPVLTEKGNSAIFTLGHTSEAVWTAEDEGQARHLAGQLAVAFSNSQLVTDLEQLQWGTLTALARAIDAKSHWTLGHSERVTDHAIDIARAMGLPARELDIMRRGGLVHDIGKIGVSAEILDKPGRLTDEEMKQMREHVNIGADIVRPIPMMAESMPIILQHHEWVNGGGYPNGLAGDELTLHARIFAVADCYDALISDRPYRPGMPLGRVMEILEQGSGKQFDPQVLEVFRKMREKEQGQAAGAEATGSLVGAD